MKKMKKLASLVLAMVTALSLCIMASAAGETGTITIDNAVSGQTYTIYEIMYLESYNATAKAYSYKVTDAWSNFINGNDIKGTYVDVDAQGYVTWHENASAADFAKVAQAYAAENKISNQGTKTASSTTVTFDNLELGYYLLDSSLGTLCSLDTTNPSVTIKEKNAEPTNEKTVQEDSTGNYGSVDDADIGQTVNFKSIVKLPKGSENVTFHDTMSDGLTLNTTNIKVYTDAALTTELATGNYTVTTGLTDGCDFEVSFTQTYLDSLAADAIVYVGYSATVNSDAVVGGDGNPNESWLDYGEDSHTTHSTTTTYTWSFDVLKYGNGNKSDVLEGAEFVLLNSAKNKVATIEDGKLTGWVDVPAAGSDGTITWQDNTVQTTDKDGKIAIAGLDADTYYLRETKAPAGYNKLSEDVTVTITPTTNTNGTMTLTPVTSEVNNQSGTELPSTGGMGTKIFYVLGAILAVGAVVLLVTKKRMNVEK